MASGYWPLLRYRPSDEADAHPLKLDSNKPTLPTREFALAETRFSMLARSDKEHSEHLLTLAQSDADERWRLYSQLAGIERTVPHEETPAAEPDIGDPEVTRG